MIKPPPLIIADVDIVGYFYAVTVDFYVSTRHHRVDHNLTCVCDLGETCPAVVAVRGYLLSGGVPAPKPPPGYFPIRPARCPICAAQTAFEPSLSSRFRGAGWVCRSDSGSAHYWETQGRERAHFARLSLNGGMK